jgi:hypothetical protein
VGQSLSQVLSPACAELLKLRLRMSTREMVDTIMGVTRVLTRTLIDSRSDGSLPGADEFLPALILVCGLVGVEVEKGRGWHDLVTDLATDPVTLCPPCDTPGLFP